MEAMVEEFINLRQGGMSVLDYFLSLQNFLIMLHPWVDNPRDEMSRSLMGVFDELV